MSFQSLQSSLQVLFVSSTAVVDSLSLNKCIHYHDSVTPRAANRISCNTGNSYGTFFLYRALLRLTLQVMLKIKSWYVTCLYVHVMGGSRSKMVGEPEPGRLDEIWMIGWSQLGRRSHWNTNQSKLSKATSHPINWHSLFTMIIYASLIPRGGDGACVCVLGESRSLCVVCYFFSVGEKRGGWFKAWGGEEMNRKLVFASWMRSPGC